MSIVSKVSPAIKEEVERLADDYDARSIATGIGDEATRQMRRVSLWDGVEIAHKQVEKLQAFKDFVHRRLDEIGIATHPDGEHSKAGCRIGDRLDIVERMRKGLQGLYERAKDQEENWRSIEDEDSAEFWLGIKEEIADALKPC